MNKKALTEADSLQEEARGRKRKSEK